MSIAARSELRFVELKSDYATVGADGTAVCETKRVLQQRWYGFEQHAGGLSKVVDEWRDVPLVIETGEGQ